MAADELHVRFMGNVAGKLAEQFSDEQVQVAQGPLGPLEAFFDLKIVVSIGAWHREYSFTDDFLEDEIAVGYAVHKAAYDFRAGFPP